MSVLRPAGPAAGAPTEPSWRLEIYEALGSTSDLCAARAASGEPEGLAVLALRQTSARGSRGRGWQSPPGNLSLSVLLRPRGGVVDAGRWPLLVGIAVVDAARPLLARPGALTLKWPNDILLVDRKVAGILIETVLDRSGSLASLVIGIGANLAVAPEVSGRAVACLADAGIVPPRPEAFARAVLAQIARWRSVLDRDGFAAVREAWLARAHPLGTPLRVVSGEACLEGAFAGLSVDGYLLLETAQGMRTVATGEAVLFTRSG